MSSKAVAIWKLDWSWRICFYSGSLPWLINCYCWLLARGLSSLTMGALYQSCFSIFMTWGLAFQKLSDPRWKWQYLLWLGLVTQRLCYILLVTGYLRYSVGGATQRCKFQKVRFAGVLLGEELPHWYTLKTLSVDIFQTSQDPRWLLQREKIPPKWIRLAFLLTW